MKNRTVPLLSRMFALLLCVSMLLTGVQAAEIEQISAPAADSAAAETTSDVPESIVFSEEDDNTAFGSASNITTEAWVNNALTAAQCKALINSQELHPQSTGWAELDNLIASMLAPYEGKDTYTKLGAIYDWLVKNVTYSWDGYSKKSAPAYDYFTDQTCLKAMTYNTCLEKSIPDDMANRAMHILSTKKGVCYDYAIAIAVVARYLGIESYVRTGYFSLESNGAYCHHGWAVLVLSGTEYIFDGQRDARNWQYYKHIRYYFGISPDKATLYHQDYAAADRKANPVRDASLLSVTADRKTYHQWTAATANGAGITAGTVTRTCTKCGEVRTETGWEQKNGSWYLYYDETAQTGWTQVDGHWYYLDPNTGTMQTGWQNIGGSWYYLGDDGIMATGWKQDAGKWYYLSSTGVMKTSWLQWNNSWYYLNASGAMKTGWLKTGGKWYFLSSDGAMTTGWRRIGHTWYYFSSDGAMKTGWLQDGSSWYYLSSTGAMKTGWLQNNGSWYYLNTAGTMKTGWLEWNDSWYYLDSSGEMQVGWISWNNDQYYFCDSGEMQTGILQWNGSSYYLDDDGALFVSGAFSYQQNVYAADEDGVLTDLADFDGTSAYTAVNGNTPYFTAAEKTTQAFETYSALDSLGRCGQAYANICTAIMPTEERGEIGSVKPTGWHSVKYSCVSGGYLYNRCHLIAFELAGENANEQNLITGTRYLNISGMLPFENLVADYVKETDSHVLYRVTPVFDGDDLVAQGVLIEAWSVEDQGESICFNVFCYNVQPGISIDYATGDSTEVESAA